ncbi:MAG: hypothetical protein INR72_15365, partial [Williamsia herbipolensis]|nr:hypothetical protein [Williamsia herbipolensis]
MHDRGPSPYDTRRDAGTADGRRDPQGAEPREARRGHDTIVVGRGHSCRRHARRLPDVPRRETAHARGGGRSRPPSVGPVSAPLDDAPRIGVIGGTGFYSFFDDEARDVVVDTPFGAPSAPISVGTVNGVRVAFVPRHGRSHEYPPHRVPYRATMWALRSLGVRRVLAPCAVGSLTPDIGPGAVVIPDQLV